MAHIPASVRVRPKRLPCRFNLFCYFAGLLLTFSALPAAAENSSALRFDFTPEHVVRPQQKVGPVISYLEVPRCAVAPNIDGIEDDACWSEAVELTDFAVPEPATKVRFCYDEQALYFSMRCEESPGRKPQGEKRERDDFRLAQDDHIHFVITPGSTSGSEHLFQVNIAGAVYDSLRGDESWNPDWTQAVKRDAAGWTVEAALPFAALGLDSSVPILGFNIGRSGPGLIIRSWNSTSHFSTACTALRLQGLELSEAPSLKTALQSSSDLTVLGSGMSIVLPRSFARPEDRWLELTFLLDLPENFIDTRLKAQIFSLGGQTPLDALTVVPAADCGLLAIDMRQHNLPVVELLLEYFDGEHCLSTAKAFLTVHTVDELSPGRKIPVKIDLPPDCESVRAWPVVFGVPFPRGTLWDLNTLRLVDQYGIELPSQTEIMARWAEDGAIQWVRFDALIDSDRACYVETQHSPTQPDTFVKLQTEGERWIVDTGAAKYILERGTSPIAEIWSGNQKIASAAGTRGLYVIDQKGRTASAAAEDETVEIEAAGPVAVCIRFEGFYRTPEGENLARHITRVEAFAGQPFAHITHTLVLTEDTRETWFKEIGWEFAVAPRANPQAFFNTDQANAAQTVSQNLTAGTSAYMLQSEHERFNGGTNVFEIVADGKQIFTGNECGDWAMLSGAKGGLQMACKDAARQHPKEFELSADRFVLKLFSSRAGEELDFSLAKLVEKWNLQEALAEQVLQEEEINAAGWSKTHELFITPVLPEADSASAAYRAALHSEPVFALIDPDWIRESDAMGPLHPKDTQNFPEAEAMIEKIFQQWSSLGHKPGQYGFVDYFAGPTYDGGSRPCSAGRYALTYGLRSSIWLIYARSGERDVRNFAKGTNKAYLDNYLTHWDVEGKVRGLYTGAGNRRPFSRLPAYWDKGRHFNISSSTDLNQFLWMYYLTGYRRGKDAVEAFAEGLKNHWDPKIRDWRQLMVFRVLTQSYGLTQDPHLKALAEATFDAFSDQEAELLLTKNRPYNSSSYKTQVDVRAIIEGWKLFGNPKYQTTALTLSEFWWRAAIGSLPVSYMNPLGVCGNFVYAETDNSVVPVTLDYGMRRAATLRRGVGASEIASVLESLPYAMNLVARGPKPFNSWAACNSYGSAVSVLVWKDTHSALDLTVKSPRAATGQQLALRAVDTKAEWGRDLDTVLERSVGAASARVPKDAPGGCYEIVPTESGDLAVFAGSPVPLVLYATNYWALPELAPSAQIFFKITPESQNPRIFFEGPAQLFDPAGVLYGDPEGWRGRVDLPPDKPGLWSFKPMENRLVKGQNFPPFYAFERAENYFEPPIAWSPEAIPAPESSPDADEVFVSGVFSEIKDQALSLTGKRTFHLEAGEAHASGDGGQFIPYKSGTVEFFCKPYWSTFDLGCDVARRNFVRVLTDKSPWTLTYRVEPYGVLEPLAPPDPSHVFHGSMYLDTPPKPAYLRVWHNQIIFESHQWVHLAWSWGPEISYGPRSEKLDLMTMRIFVNGAGKKWTIFRTAINALALGSPQTLIISTLDGAIDELRISDKQRYQADFAPPSKEPFALDEFTRALFHFDGSLTGESYGTETQPTGVITP